MLCGYGEAALLVAALSLWPRKCFVQGITKEAADVTFSQIHRSRHLFTSRTGFPDGPLLRLF